MANCNEYDLYMNDTLSLMLKRERLIRDYIQLHDEWNRAVDCDEDDEEVEVIQEDMRYVLRQIREIDALLAA